MVSPWALALSILKLRKQLARLILIRWSSSSSFAVGVETKTQIPFRGLHPKPKGRGIVIDSGCSHSGPCKLRNLVRILATSSEFRHWNWRCRNFSENPVDSIWYICFWEGYIMLYKSWLTPANVPILSSVLRNQFTGALHDHLRPRRGAVMPWCHVMPWCFTMPGTLDLRIETSTLQSLISFDETNSASFSISVPSTLAVTWTRRTGALADFCSWWPWRRSWELIYNIWNVYNII